RPTRSTRRSTVLPVRASVRFSRAASRSSCRERPTIMSARDCPAAGSWCTPILRAPRSPKRTSLSATPSCTARSKARRISAVSPEDEQTRVETELAASGKGRNLHLDRCDEPLARSLIEKHLRYTGSTLALTLLDNWENERAKFVKVFPHEYKRALSEMFAKRAAARVTEAAKARQVA